MTLSQPRSRATRTSARTSARATLARSVMVAGLLALAALACGGAAKVGETCTTRGSTSECESGAVCSQNTSGATVCLKTCLEQTDCAASESCNGVEGSSLKACRTKK